MANEHTLVEGLPSLKRPRLAESIASELRTQIVSGRLADGDTLPRLERLMEVFHVSGPCIREAFRILESEGLLTVRRGNVGGAVIHRPTADSAAYMLGLVLEAERTQVGDVGVALANLIPLCVRFCAERPDRDVAVVPVLEALHAESILRLDDGGAFALASNQFHQGLVECCGNNTLVLLVGSLHWLWAKSGTGTLWANEDDGPSPELRQVGVSAHRQVIDAIRSGDARAAEALAREHAWHPGSYSNSDVSKQPVIVTENRATGR